MLKSNLTRFVKNFLHSKINAPRVCFCSGNSSPDHRKNMEPSCVGENDGLTFWLAKPEDYDDVMSISEGIYWGNDYLPHRYREWMVEPDRVVILARRTGKLVRGYYNGLLHLAKYYVGL